MAIAERGETRVAAPKDAPLRERASVFTDEITMDFADACQTAAAAGLQYVDIRRVWGSFSHDVPRERWNEMARILDDNGLRIGAVQSNFGKCPISGPEYEEHMRFFPILVEQAQFFGTDTMRVFPFWNEHPMRHPATPQTGASSGQRGGGNEGEAWPGGIRPNLEERLPEIVRRIRPAVDLAEKEGIKLGFEPEHTTHSGSPQEVARVVDAVNSSALGVAWDCNNGWDDLGLDKTYSLFKDRGAGIVNVHVKERVMSPDERRSFAAAGGDVRRQPALLGTGAMPWPRLIETLERGGFHGVYSIETHFGSRGEYGWPKLKAATTYYMYALRELLAGAEVTLGGRA